MPKQLNLQDVFLNHVRKGKIPAIVVLTNGYKIKGTIKGFDNFIILMEVEGKQQLVYKSAVGYIQPLKFISHLFDRQDDDHASSN